MKGRDSLSVKQKKSHRACLVDTLSIGKHRRDRGKSMKGRDSLRVFSQVLKG